MIGDDPIHLRVDGSTEYALPLFLVDIDSFDQRPPPDISLGERSCQWLSL